MSEQNDNHRPLPTDDQPRTVVTPKTVTPETVTPETVKPEAAQTAMDQGNNDGTRLLSETDGNATKFCAPETPDSQKINPDGTVVVNRTSEETTRVSALALSKGHRLHEYRIDSVLGQGGFGITYLATDINLKAKVAIKEYLPETFAYRRDDTMVTARTGDDEHIYHLGLESFLAEARILATFRHPNIVRVARFFEANNTAYIVLEYEHGQPLKRWRQKHSAISELDFLNLLLPLMDGLDAVHESGYLHRDIKPDNIYVRDEDGSFLLLDFGAAQHATQSAENELSYVCTPGYGPIEQFTDGLLQGPWTDIYALGATLYWFATGRKPMDAAQRTGNTDPLEKAAVICDGQYSPEFLEAIDWALSPLPEDRPKDLTEFRNKLFAAHQTSLGLQEALQENTDGEAVAFDETGPSILTHPRLWPKRLARFGRAMRRPASWPIAVKLMLAMLATALLPMIITAYFNLQGSLASVSRGELQNLEQLAQSTAGRISQLLGDSKNLANYLSGDEDFVRFLSNPQSSVKQQLAAKLEGLIDIDNQVLTFLSRPVDNEKQALKRKLNGLIKANPDVQLVMVMDTKGTALISSNNQVMGRNFSFREYFKEAIQGNPHMTGIVVGSVAGQAGVFYSNPVFDSNNNIIGTVVLRILASSVSKILSEATEGSSQVPFLIDGDGVIVRHPDTRFLYHSLIPLSQEKQQEIKADQRFRRSEVNSINQPILAKAMIGSQQRGSVSYQSKLNNTAEIAGYAPVPGHDWVIGLVETRDYFEAPLNKLFMMVIYSMVVVGLIFMFLAMLFSRSIVRPIEALTAAAHALKSGDYENANVAVKSTDEVGQLSRTFNILIDVLRQREHEQKRADDEAKRQLRQQS
ncbi:protein kinase domain-containing protein [Motiliproteus sp. MSK22-1]|uniref:protein kinase domain-containing protein n=1 Tax=Motiliproteus sp. MSK22-1 TaxID=1897630 RepID=UPI000976F081|nr:cache domain-containing protein [Motiliproteus sp. MSK22-1]OMH30298.1 hypothetical protein BGP75_18075 [Motiliproteus sp. MSK22-1]